MQKFVHFKLNMKKTTKFRLLATVLLFFPTLGFGVPAPPPNLPSPPPEPESTTRTRPPPPPFTLSPPPCDDECDGAQVTHPPTTPPPPPPEDTVKRKTRPPPTPPPPPPPPENTRKGKVRPPPLLPPPPPRENTVKRKTRPPPTPPPPPPPEVSEKPKKIRPPPMYPPPPPTQTRSPPPMYYSPPPCMPDYACPDGNTPQGPEDCLPGSEFDEEYQVCVDIDECLVGHNCTDPRVCVNTQLSYNCVCKEGFREVNGECKELCGGYICLNEASCVTGDFGDGVPFNEQRCRCDEGVLGDGITWCKDFNECSTDTNGDISDEEVKWNDTNKTVLSCGQNCKIEFNGTVTSVVLANCHPDAKCINQYGGHRCECNDDFYGYGTDCKYNYCLRNQCPQKSVCDNLDDRYKCTCKDGYYGPVCAPITPCNPDPCGAKGRCVITGLQKFTCNCQNGYAYVEDQGCQNVDECEIEDYECVPFSTCADTEGSYRCECNSGFREAEGECRDIDECEENIHECGEHSECTNNLGGYSCKCTCGFSDLGGGGRDGADCNFDECLYGEHNCSQTCVNTRDGFRCECEHLFSLERDGISCRSFHPCRYDVCQAGVSQCYRIHHRLSTPVTKCHCNPGYVQNYMDSRLCRPESACVASLCEQTCSGSSKPDEQCSCRAGYIVSPWSKKCCVKEECTETTCHGHGKCNKTKDTGISCNCDDGYMGERCEKREDCTIANCGPGNCEDLLKGGYRCNCYSGYTEENRTCVDLDECEAISGVCSAPGQRCINYRPYYSCTCMDGYRYPDDRNDFGSGCYEKVLLPFGHGIDRALYPWRRRSRDYIGSGRFGTQVYFQDQGYTRFQIMSNGILILERGPVSAVRIYPLPSGTDLPTLSNDGSVQHALIAPFMSDYAYWARQSVIFYRQSTFQSENQADIERLRQANVLVNEYFPTNGSNFEAAEVLVVTWWKMITRIGRWSRATFKDDSFQLVLATNGQKSYVIFNYRIGSMDARHAVRRRGVEPKIGFASTAGYKYTERIANPRRPDLFTNIGKTARFAYKIGELDVMSPETQCRQWYMRQPKLSASSRTNVCPRTFFRLLIYGWHFFFLPYQSYPKFGRFKRWTSGMSESDYAEMNEFAGQNCFQYRYLSNDGSARICCYLFHPWIPILRSPLLQRGYNPDPLFTGGQIIRHSPWRDLENFLEEDVKPRETCCHRTNLCHLYKEKRPSTTAMPLPWWWRFRVVYAYGEPSLSTLDGNTFSFSGLGEYTFLTSSKLIIQGRFVQSTDKDGLQIQGTVLMAVALQSTNYSLPSTEFKFVANNSADIFNMTITINGTRISSDQMTSLQGGVLQIGGASISTEEGGVQIFFEPGTITLKPGKKNLILTIASSALLSGEAKGLYGQFDGNATNDFEFRSGQVLDLDSLKFTPFTSPANLTEERMNEFIPNGTILEEKVFDFGQSWLVQENETLFTYGAGESWATMRNASFVPEFLPQLLAEATEEMIETARSQCKSGETFSLPCVRTLLITKDESLTAETSEAEKGIESEQESANNEPPSWVTEISEIEVQVRKPFTLELVANDTNEFTYSLDGTIVNGTNATIGLTSGIFTWTPTDITNHTLAFVVTDKFGLSAQQAVTIQICDCQNEGNCSYDNMLTSASGFQTFGCDCPGAYAGSNCEKDKDECVPNPCTSGECIDNVAPETGYICNMTCDEGEELIDNVCYNIDYCNTTQNTCEDICETIRGGFECSCGSGFQLNATDNSTCDDINECVTSNPCTALKTTCLNTEGNYSCVCMEGYDGDPLVGCSDINECTAETYNCNVTTEDCKNLEGNYTCVCKTGFTQSAGEVCVDVDECKAESHSCTSPQETCQNTQGDHTCICSVGFDESTDGVCGDVDECSDNSHTCPKKAACENRIGSFTCQCISGYTYNDATNTCDDIDECASNGGKGPCDTTCKNTVGSFACSCESGFKLNSDGMTCSDVNECDDATTCQQNCTNIPGNYTCECFKSFNLVDGSCVPAVSCNGDNAISCVNGECFVNSSGSANCQCKPGYEVVNSTHCQDILECDVEDKCGINAVCTELDGSYNCSCDPFFVDDSGSTSSTVVSCVAVNPPTTNEILDRFIGTTWVYLTWTITSTADVIRVTISKNDSSETPVDFELTPNITAYNFTELDHDTTYQATFSSEYKGVQSGMVTIDFLTKAIVNPPILEDISETNVTSQSIAIAWRKPDIGGCTSVQIHYSEIGSGTEQLQTSASSPVPIGSLRAATNYTFQASCLYKTFESERSDFIAQFTRPRPPKNLRHITNDSLPYGSIGLEFDPPTVVPETYQYDINPPGPNVSIELGNSISVVVLSIPPGTATEVTFYSFNQGLRSIGASITVVVPTTTTTAVPTTIAEYTSTIPRVTTVTTPPALTEETTSSATPVEPTATDKTTEPQTKAATPSSAPDDETMSPQSPAETTASGNTTNLIEPQTVAATPSSAPNDETTSSRVETTVPSNTTNAIETETVAATPSSAPDDEITSPPSPVESTVSSNTTNLIGPQTVVATPSSAPNDETTPSPVEPTVSSNTANVIEPQTVAATPSSTPDDGTMLPPSPVEPTASSNTTNVTELHTAAATPSSAPDDDTTSSPSPVEPTVPSNTTNVIEPQTVAATPSSAPDDETISPPSPVEPTMPSNTTYAIDTQTAAATPSTAPLNETKSTSSPVGPTATNAEQPETAPTVEGVTTTTEATPAQTEAIETTSAPPEAPNSTLLPTETTQTTIVSCEIGEVIVNGSCQGYTPITTSAKLTETTFTGELNDPTSAEYNTTYKIFNSTFRELFDAINVSVHGVTQITFKNGSVIGTGNVLVSDTVTDDSEALAVKINKVIENAEVDVVSKYGVDSIVITDFNECLNSNDNGCHMSATCNNTDPGYICFCNSGYRDKDLANPGTSCEPLCELDGEPFCKNGGTCLNSIGNADPTCECTTLFQGARCGESIAEETTSSTTTTTTSSDTTTAAGVGPETTTTTTTPAEETTSSTTTTTTTGAGPRTTTTTTTPAEETTSSTTTTTTTGAGPETTTTTTNPTEETTSSTTTTTTTGAGPGTTTTTAAPAEVTTTSTTATTTTTKPETKSSTTTTTTAKPETTSSTTTTTTTKPETTPSTTTTTTTEPETTSSTTTTSVLETTPSTTTTTKPETTSSTTTTTTTGPETTSSTTTTTTATEPDTTVTMTTTTNETTPSTTTITAATEPETTATMTTTTAETTPGATTATEQTAIIPAEETTPSTSTSGFVLTSPVPCEFRQVNVNDRCQGYTTTICSLRLTSLTYTTQLDNPNSNEYIGAFAIFESTFFELFGAINVSMYGVQITFSNGSVVGTGKVLISDTVTDDSTTLVAKINRVIESGGTGVVNRYGVDWITIADHNECLNGNDNNCHMYGTCTNTDPGFECGCNSGYRDKNSTNSGTSCEPQCMLDGEPYCMNDGTCQNSTGNGNPTCSCSTFRQGKRCEETNGGAVAGVVLGVLGGVFLIVLAVILIRRFTRNGRTKHKQERLAGGDETRKRYDEISSGSTNDTFGPKERHMHDILA